MSRSTPRPDDPPAAELRLGVDVGGTNTDAVIVDPAGQVLASAKSPTTADVTAGVGQVIRTVLSDSGLAPSAIGYAMLGTTHCTNAIVTCQGLNRVGVIRLGAPATLAIEPLLTWPTELRQAVCASRTIVRGGHEYDGEPLAGLDAGELRAVLRDMRDAVAAVAISGVFAPVNPAHEHAARDIVHEVLGEDIAVSLSSQIGSLSLLERENATVLNAALTGVARTAIDGFARAVQGCGISARLFLGQNDGSLMSLDYALQHPIFTIASGPANSIRGAAALSRSMRRWSLILAAPRPISACSTEAFRASRRWRLRSAACGPIFGCRIWCQSAWAGAAGCIATTAAGSVQTASAIDSARRPSPLAVGS